MRDLQNSRVLVTGAGGFLARHIVPKLVAQGAEVTGVDLAPGIENARRLKSKAKLVEGDITEYASIEKATRMSKREMKSFQSIQPPEKFSGRR